MLVVAVVDLVVVVAAVEDCHRTDMNELDAMD